MLAWVTNYLSLQVVFVGCNYLGQVLRVSSEISRATSVLYVHLEIAYYTEMSYADIWLLARVFTYIKRFNDSWKLQLNAESQNFVEVTRRVELKPEGHCGRLASAAWASVPVACLGSFREKQCRRWPIG